jgi:hypothetical protein
VKLAIVFGNIVQAPKAKNLARGEGAAGDDDFAGEAHAALRSDVVGSDYESGGSSHYKVTITHDAIPYLAH